MTSDFQLFSNPSIWCAVVGWFLAQLLKFIFHYIETKQVDFRTLVSTGGMPSSHSSMVAAMATSVGLQTGFSGPIFAIAFILAAVVMFDAQSVRRAAGSQARLLNQIVSELLKDHHLSEQKLAELLGHTPIEVLFGMAMGIATSLFMHAIVFGV